jgi:2-phospho-L-lactate guanylyltransferase
VKRAWAVVPVKGRHRAKERLTPTLSPRERGELFEAMWSDVLAALRGSQRLAGVAVLSADDGLLALGRGWGAEALAEPRPLGYAGAADEAARIALQRGCDALLVLPADLPLITPRDLDALLELAEPGWGVVLCPDRNGRGTNALLRRPPAAIAAAFGPDSLARHRQAAAAAGLACRVWSCPNLALDVDTADDLRRLLTRGAGAATRRALARFGLAERLAVPVAVGVGG